MVDLHVYSNGVVERFVAESVDDAIELAKEYWDSMGYEPTESDFDFTREPDDMVLTITGLDPSCPYETDGKQTKTCAEWARANGRGFLCTTEW